MDVKRRANDLDGDIVEQREVAYAPLELCDLLLRVAMRGRPRQELEERVLARSRVTLDYNRSDLDGRLCARFTAGEPESDDDDEREDAHENPTTSRSGGPMTQLS